MARKTYFSASALTAICPLLVQEKARKRNAKATYEIGFLGPAPINLRLPPQKIKILAEISLFLTREYKKTKPPPLKTFKANHRKRRKGQKLFFPFSLSSSHESLGGKGGGRNPATRRRPPFSPPFHVIKSPGEKKQRRKRELRGRAPEKEEGPFFVSVSLFYLRR